MADLTCEMCGVPVYRKPRARGVSPRFCAPCLKARAREAARRKRDAERPAAVRNCPHCGAAFDREGLGKKFCSAECRVAACRPTQEAELEYRRRTRERALAKRLAKGTPIGYRWCLVCGRVFFVVLRTRGAHGRQMCSDSCRYKRMATTPKGAQTRQKAKDRRRARLANAYVEDVDRQAIFERDGWCCQLCGKKVDRQAKCPEYLAPTLDHIVPIACGGMHEAANVQLAHFICNSRKTHHGAGDQLRLIG